MTPMDIMMMGRAGGVAAAAIQYIGGASSENSVSVAVPAHQTGDLILACAARDDSLTPPALPSGWTSLGTQADNASANFACSRLCYKFAASGAENATGFTDADTLIVHVYRGVTAVGAYNGGALSGSTTINYPALTMQVTNGSSWVVAFADTSNSTGVHTAPTGMVTRINEVVVSPTHEATSHDTNGGVASWAGQNVALGANLTHSCHVVELKV